ncbi:MAG: 23S rRNA (pseudouridine(1915)-N(3))-methyltransferase RlmH [Desulfuromonas sp.]|nr:MAG: 23S rRNA (pseudouridine(1915)-N(3))-methyltransferase RlmH [Desulfuromonas sp.]
MKLTVLCVGKLSIPFLREGAEEYRQRLKRYLPVEEIELKEEKRGGKKARADFVRNSEAEALLAKIPPSSYVIGLDEKGRRASSEQLATTLDKHMTTGTNNLCLLIGGAYGLTDELRRQCDSLLSLSDMTMTHQMARMFLYEQLYRAMTIIRGEPYHNS